MRLEYIRSFISVVDCKSFSIAAQKTFLSQPTISTHIKRLEAELGVQLLVRSTKDVILSEEGVMFYPFAVRMLETENEALSRLRREERPIEGRVSIAVSAVPGYYLMPDFISWCRGKYPDLGFQLKEGDAAAVIQSVLHFETEFGICNMEASNENCISQPLMEDRLVLITPNTEEYRNMNGTFPVERFQNETYVLRDEGGTIKGTESAEKALKIQKKPLKIALKTDSPELLRIGVEKGLGIAFISNLAAQEYKKNGKILTFEIPGIDTRKQFYLIYHKDRVMTLPITTVIRMLRQYCQKLEK